MCLRKTTSMLNEGQLDFLHFAKLCVLWDISFFRTVEYRVKPHRIDVASENWNQNDIFIIPHLPP